ncbi:MAG: TRAP transporter large permease [Candidatus Eremiobacteraeota bacterium]|nr:TRAP transporter large permease [Candidatus Eremiobacteraeota bacterium]
MTLFAVFLGYFGVPVAFSMMASVFLTVVLFTHISLASMVGQLFNGINTLNLLAVPFFLLVGELMLSANITIRLITLAQALVGHMRSGLAQVVAVFSLFFSGISGSSTADVVAISTVLGPAMKAEGYDPPFTAALVAAASTIANMVPPSILAVVYGSVGNVSIGGLFLGGATPGLMVAIGLMIYSYIWGPVGIHKERATFGHVAESVKLAILPLFIPIIIVGGILAGQFTPVEAGAVALLYVILVVLPLMTRGHFKNLPRDFIYAGALYALPIMAVAGASAFGWVLAYLRGPDVVSGWIEQVAGHNPTVILFLIIGILTIVGDFLEGIPAIIIFMPLFLELAKLGNIHPVHMGVCIIVNLAFGLITPPFGLILLLSSSLQGVPWPRALLAALPLYVIFFIVMALIIVFPNLVLWLPRILFPQSIGCFQNAMGGWTCPPM